MKLSDNTRTLLKRSLFRKTTHPFQAAMAVPMLLTVSDILSSRVMVGRELCERCGGRQDEAVHDGELPPAWI